MFRITLPASGPKPRYYQAYVGYIRRILERNGLSYMLKGVVNQGEVIYPTGTKFLMEVNEKKFIIDYSDNLDYMPNWDSFDAYFKFHYCTERHGTFPKMYPFVPISFYDWNQFNSLRKEIKYVANNDLILNMQRPGGNALERRTYVKGILRSTYGKEAIFL